MSDQGYISVQSNEASEIFEVELEEDGSVLITSLASIFGVEVSGLAYMNTVTGNKRLLRCIEGVIWPPKSGWGDTVYFKLSSTASSHVVSPKLELSGLEEPSPTHVSIGSTSVKKELVFKNNVLTKKELLVKCSQSGVARAACYQWNKLNSTIRRMVHSTKFYGSGGMSICNGTTKEDAMKNRQEKDDIVSSSSVKSLYGTFTLEDGSKVLIDELSAANHIKYVLSDMRRKRPLVIDEIETDIDDELYPKQKKMQENDENEENICQNIMTKAPSTSKGKGKGKGSVNGIERPKCVKRLALSDYEIKRAKNMEENLKVLEDLEIEPLLPNSLADTDAIFVAKCCMNKDGFAITKDDMHTFANLYDIELSGESLRNQLITLGCKMVDLKNVTLKRKKDVRSTDIKFLYD